MDYVVVLCIVGGLAIFMHADATHSAVFNPIGVLMLTVSLTCDGMISNMSETIMARHGVGQDEFIFRMYSIALVAITGAAALRGDLQAGLAWMAQPGTFDEVSKNVPVDERSWSVLGKTVVMILFSSMGFFGSSCSAAITKMFGALTMSITSTARKATTLFLSFFLFNNECTFEHIAGIVIFMTALTTKSLRRRSHSNRPRRSTQKLRDSNGISRDDQLELVRLLSEESNEGDVLPVPSASNRPSSPHHRRTVVPVSGSPHFSVPSPGDVIPPRGSRRQHGYHVV